MKETNIMFSNLKEEKRIMIGSETLERTEKHIYFGQTVSVNQAHGEEIKRTALGWSSFGRHKHA